ncbi:LOW QUALITY PROTEIN: uncharacterized protein LOC110988534 [Acanthaster planci]|uniref:LOW QUALITY PROTEIN: uncharacterized protein LOC110988534 n=1 Tax=Acanthaster planci TaxID=133434 RepID=A0A8B7ZR08_ACAPL|nr:LOW QUALITY PROTEIN: uncharacterized protein LOC110988534 [Acanthaster planci]
MPSNSPTVFPPLRRTSPQQRARTAHTESSLPLAGSARVSTHPLLPPHHMMRRHPHHHRQHHMHPHHHFSPQTHRRHISDTSRAACSSATDHIVELCDAPELPEISELLRQGAASRATIVQMIEQGICRTSFTDVQRFPAIHPSIMSARMEKIVRYITFVTAPPIERRAPKDRPKSWDRKAYKPLGPEECFRCQLQTEHAVCERHKYLRVGGGFRHSYWYIKQTMDIVEAEHRKVAEEVRERYMAELASKARQAQTRRRIKTYVRGADGKVVSRYCFVTEEEYQEMKKDLKLAKKILGVAEDEELEDWVSSKRKYVMDEKGEIVKVSRRKIGDSAYEESIESADVNNNYYYGKDGRRRGRRGRHHRRYSDSDSFESGMGNSILEEGEGGHRRRRRYNRGRHGSSGRYSSVESVESYVSAGGTRRERVVRRRRRRRSSDSYESSYYEDKDGKMHRRRRRHRRRSYSGSDSGTGLDSDDSRYRDGRRRGGRHGHHRGHGRHHRGRHHDDYSDEYSSGSSYDSRDGSGGRRRGRRHRGGRRRRYDSSYSDDSDEDSHSRRRRGGRRHRRRHRSYSDESDLSCEDADGRRRSRRRRGRHHRSRHRSGHSSDSSDYTGSSDSRVGDRRHHRRRHHRRGRGSPDDGSWSDESSGGGEGGRGRRRGRRRRRRRDSDDSGTSLDDDDYDGRAEPEGAGGGEGDTSDPAVIQTVIRVRMMGLEIGRGVAAGQRHRRHRYSDDSDASYYSDDDDSADRRGRRRRGRKGGGKKSGGGGRRRHRGGGSNSGGYDSRDYSSSEGSYSSGSSYYSSDDFSSSESLPVSSEVSDASDPSSVHSSDISDIDSALDEEERQRVKAQKKARKLEEKRAAKQQQKVEARKAAREVKREQIRQEKKEQRRERRRERRGDDGEGRSRGRGRDRRDKKRRHHTPTSRSVSACSSVSSVHSDEISDVDSALVGEERERAIEAKKTKKKAEKRVVKQKEKVEKVQEEHRQKRREKEQKRMKREIEREMERMSTPSDISSVRSSDVSSLSDAEELTEEQRALKKEEKKQKKKEEKKKERKMLKAVQKVMAKRRNRRGSGSSDDSYARGKQDFYDLPPEVQKTMVKYSKGSKRRFLEEEGMQWLDDWKNKKEREKRKRERKKNKKEKEEFTGETVELRAPDGRVIRVPKTSMYDVWKQARKIRLKKDGTVARDSDSDAESIELDSEGNMVNQPKTVELKDPSYYVKWEGFAETPEPPATPTQGGKIKFQGVRKVQHAFRKDKGFLADHLRKVLDTASELSDPKPGERGDAIGGRDRGAWESVDFISHFRLVESYKLDPLGRAFVVEDEDYDCSLNGQEMRSAIEGVPFLSSIKPKQLEYVLKVLNIDDHSAVSFKMFAVVAGVCERMCNMDSFGKYILDKTDLLDIARKMALYKSIFYCNVNSERSENHITAESLRIELMAGGLNREQERYIMSKMNPNEYGEISFFDYMAYIPLFLSMHENIINNPLDRQEKYTRLDRAEVQRDMNPLGLPLQRTYLNAPKEIFPSGIPVMRMGEDRAPAPVREFIERGELLDGAPVGGKTGRLPSIIQKSSSPMSAKRGGRGKNVSMSLP